MRGPSSSRMDDGSRKGSSRSAPTACAVDRSSALHARSRAAGSCLRRRPTRSHPRAGDAAARCHRPERRAPASSTCHNRVRSSMPGGFTATPRQLAWVDRQGREQTIAAPPNNYQQPRLTGRHAAGCQRRREHFDLDVCHGNALRLTNDAAVQHNPAWTADGRSVVYDSEDGSGVQILRRAADATGRGGDAPARRDTPRSFRGTGRSSSTTRSNGSR